MLKKLYEKSHIWFSVSWIIAYCVLLSIGDSLSDVIGIQKSVTLPIALLLSVVLFFFLKKNDLCKEYGLCRAQIPARKMLYYLPVFVMLTANLWFGVTNEGEAVISNAMKYADVYEGKLNFAVGGHKLIIQNGKFYARSTVLNPLTTVGVCADGSVVIVCVDGRSAQSAGASYADIAQIYAELELDVVTVLCLDGGGSTTFVMKSEDDFKIENAPSDGKEREVQSVLLVNLP